MIDTTKTLKESLDELGIVGSYVWKPDRFHAKYDGEYLDVDVVSDGSAHEIEEAMTEAGDNALTDIRDRKENKLALLHRNESNYMNIMANVITKYQELYLYFLRYPIPVPSTIMATGIANLNNM